MRKIVLISIALILALGGLGVGYAAWTDEVTINGTVDTGKVCMGITCPITSDDPSLTPYFTGWVVGIGGPGADWNVDDGYSGTPGFYNHVHQTEKNVGWVTTNCTLVPPPRKAVTITLHNVYPCYWDHISFGVENCGTIPIILDHVQFLDINGNPLIGYDENGNPVNILKTKNKYAKFDLSGNGIYDLEILWGDNYGVQIEPGFPWDISFWIHVLQDEEIDFTVPHDFTFAVEVTGVQWNEYPLP